MQVKKFYKPLITFTSLFIVYFLFKFVIPLIFPFLISGVLALFLYPWFQKHTKRLHISPTILGILFILFFFLLFHHLYINIQYIILLVDFALQF